MSKVSSAEEILGLSKPPIATGSHRPAFPSRHSSGWRLEKANSDGGFAKSKNFFCAGCFAHYFFLVDAAGRVAWVNLDWVRMKWSAADIRHFNFLHPRRLFCANFRIAVFTLAPDQAYGSGDLRVALARTHEHTQIMAGLREQAGVQLAIGR